VTALSEYHRDYLVEKERISLEKIEIIPNGIEIEKFGYVDKGETRKSLGITEKAPVVGILAMLRHEKAHDVFLKAAALVLQRVPSAYFLIIGDGTERGRLEKFTRELKIHEKVYFLGVRQDITQLLGILDVAVLSSHPVVETFPVSVLEYMASSKPVVATRVGSLSELVEEGVTGFLVDAGDFKSMANRIISLLDNPTLACRMGKEGRKKVQKQYSVAKMVQRHEQLFQRLLSESRK
jgi:glycosyltransferase involved in cell wall biosynthesis